MNYQELVGNVIKEYSNNNIISAYKYYVKMFDLLDDNLDKCNNEEQKFGVYKNFNTYMQQIDNEIIYRITDYGKEKAYREELYNKNYLRLVDITHNEKMSVLDEFCDFYEWGILKSGEKDKYDLYDIQCGCYVDDENYDIKGLINRIVGRAIDYFRDEDYIEEDSAKYQLEYANKLLEIAKEYKKEDKWEESWLKTFENELKDLKKAYNLI